MKDKPEIKVISFDVEGTLASPEFSSAVWHEKIPSLYARQYRLSFDEAAAKVKKAYDEVGDSRREWYDIRYWFRRFQLGDYRPAMDGCREKAARYPEVADTLNRLSASYTLIVSSGSAREFLPYLLDGISSRFKRVFSSISDYGQVKTPEFYRTVSRELGVEPGEVVHVGDSWRFDVEAPQAAGIRALFLDRENKEGKADSLSSLSELKDRM